MITTIIKTHSNEYCKTHETYDYAWQYVQAFVAVTKDATWQIVVD